MAPAETTVRGGGQCEIPYGRKKSAQHPQMSTTHEGFNDEEVVYESGDIR